MGTPVMLLELKEIDESTPVGAEDRAVERGLYAVTGWPVAQPDATLPTGAQIEERPESTEPSSQPAPARTPATWTWVPKPTELGGSALGAEKPTALAPGLPKSEDVTRVLAPTLARELEWADSMAYADGAPAPEQTGRRWIEPDAPWLSPLKDEDEVPPSAWIGPDGRPRTGSSEPPARTAGRAGAPRREEWIELSARLSEGDSRVVPWSAEEAAPEPGHLAREWIELSAVTDISAVEWPAAALEEPAPEPEIAATDAPAPADRDEGALQNVPADPADQATSAEVPDELAEPVADSATPADPVSVIDPAPTAEPPPPPGPEVAPSAEEPPPDSHPAPEEPSSNPDFTGEPLPGEPPGIPPVEVGEPRSEVSAATGGEDAGLVQAIAPTTDVAV